LLFERILPKLAEMLKLPGNCGYSDIALALAEKIAIEVGVNRFKIYTFNELIERIIKNYKQGRRAVPTKEESLISKFSFLLLFSGDSLLKKLVQDLLDERVIKSLKAMQEQQDKK
jgi:NTE family protein